jgi:putative aldouronate transport system substrate-binding protein
MSHHRQAIGRRQFLELAGTVGLATLAGCAPKPAAEPAQPAAPTGAQAPAPTAAPTDAPAAQPTSAPLVDVTYTYPGAVPADLQLVQDAMNEILEPRIHTHLTLEPIDWGTYRDRLTMRFAAGEECGIIFTAPWFNSYVEHVANGNLYPLDDLLPSKAPGLWESLPSTVWGAARVQGHIYAVINQQIFPKPWGIEVRQDMAEKYALDPSAIRRWEDMEPFLNAVKEGEGITPEFWAQPTGAQVGDTYFMHQYWGFDPIDDAIGGGNVGLLGIKATDDKLQVLLMPEQPEFLEAMRLTKKLVDGGIIPKDPLPDAEAVAATRAGQYIYSHHVEKPGNGAELNSRYGYDWLIQNLTVPLILDTAGCTATLNGICATATHPENAMMVLEQINTDVDVYTLICRGIEGKHWVWVDKEQNLCGFPEGVDGENSSYNPSTDWMFGNQFNVSYRHPAQLGAWPATRQMNDSATPSKALGFTFDRKPVETELAQVAAVYAEYFMPINDGQVDPDAATPELLAQLKAAGVSKIVDELQRQLGEWKAS